MPIHGHTKIELTSQTTGEVETIEKDNIVTNAVCTTGASTLWAAGTRPAAPC